ncbi:PREDICTED: uncharacterized protein LOC106101971 [Papilio polytes]|uniref:uncharacterized protein LOC106101971 n=1 Tax=Papilio polytes TaxID=76194 RepID=UPI00067680B1|nr:PREDICTED: uncharacterized protein LOC106101971 [Papilio polytes]
MAKDKYVLQSPKDQRFYRNFATLATFLSVGNQEWWGYKKPNKVQIYHRRLACILSSQFKSFEKVMKLFMDKIHLYNYKDMNAFTRQVMNWAITHIINTYVCIMGCIILLVFNSLNYMLVFHIIGHIQMFKYKCKTEFSDTLSNNETRDLLISLIKEHSFIIEVFNNMKHAFGYYVTGNYCHNLLSDSFLLYQIMFGNKEDWLVYGLMVVVYLGGLIVMSLVLEEIRRESVDIADDVYSIPWQNMSISNQKILMMVLARSQPPLEFISAGGLRAGVQPTISIIKSTFTYYVMLKTSIKLN